MAYYKARYKYEAYESLDGHFPEYLIKTYTNESETVLDFTMGSGTTMLACKNLNRNGIGIEMDEGYFNIAKKRIDEA